MNYKEKYKEALMRARDYHNSLLQDEITDCGLVNELEHIFPELKENEGDRIRKAIIQFFELQDDSITYSLVPKKDILAWLEKQNVNREYVFRPLAGTTIEKAAKQAVELESKVVLAFNGAYIPVGNKTKDEIIAEYHNWVKKQGEQPLDKIEPNPTWGEEDEEMLTWLCRIIHTQRQNEQKQTWEPSAAQLIVIKDLIEDKNTSKVNKVILRGMFDEFKQYFGL